MKFIEKRDKFNMSVNNAVPPKIYGLVKTHKANISRENIILRPVVSYIGSPLYPLSKHLGSTISSALSDKYAIRNSYEFFNSIKHKVVPPGFILASFDVVSLFTCLPQDFLLQSVEIKWDSISKYTKMDLPTFKEAVKLCLDNSFFVNNGTYYYQCSGTPMGAPISSGIANLAMEIVLERIVDLLPFDLPFLYIFVDDILTAIPEGIIDETLEMFNSINGKIQFTIEIEKDSTIPFLDLKIKRELDGSISTEFYQKPSASGRILNFFSNHSTALKVNTAIGLIKRVFTFSTNKPDAEKCNTVSSILLKNQFPRKLINKLICEYKNKAPALNTVAIPEGTIHSKPPITSIKYIRGLSEAICRKIRSYNNNLTISTQPERSLATFFTKLKDKTPNESQSQLIYSVPCSSCAGCYIGMTWKQYMEERMKQHERQQNRIMRGETVSGKTAITEHARTESHYFDFSRAKIIDKNKNYNCLKILEMLHISSNQHACNFRSDVCNTIQQYQNLIQTLKTKNLI